MASLLALLLFLGLARLPLVSADDCQPHQWKRDVGDIMCRYHATSGEDVNYYTCTELALTYETTVEKFFELNPSVNADCGNIQASTQYCVKGYIQPLISTDGFCGPLHNDASCTDTAAPCCNGLTWTCGSTAADCAIGVCYEGHCDGLGYTTDGLCGPNHDDRKCGGTWGECCSMGGVCGSGPSFCGIGNCDSGNCTQSEPPEQEEPPSLDGDTPDGTCGGVDGYTCSVIFGNCCNANGQCGSDPADCAVATGCQLEFGCCDGNCPGPNGGPGEAPAFNHYGCFGYSDSLPAALDGASTTDTRYMSQQSCAKFCITTGGFDYFSIEGGDTCRCGNGDAQIAVPAAAFVAKRPTLCDKTCSGAPAQTCGGDPDWGVLDLFGTPPAPPGVMAGYKYLGCYVDLTDGYRALWEDDDLSQTMTVEACKQWCVDEGGYRYFGVEWGVECYCGNRRDESSSLVGDYQCGMPCAGNEDQICGDDQRLSLYGPHDTATHVYLGCQTNLDPLESPTLDIELHVSPRMTNQMCSAKCTYYNYFGTESGDTCRCGDEIQVDSRPLPHSQCNAPCDGDSSQKCGGHDKVSTWMRNPHGPSYIYQGCVTDEDPNWWVLGGQWDWSEETSIQGCGWSCLYAGYDLFALENGDMCLCGETLQEASTAANEATCDTECTGDWRQMCGGYNRASLYRWFWP